MLAFFIIAGALVGTFGALVAARFVGKKYNWSLKFEHAPYGPTMLALLLIGIIGGAALNGVVADSAGFLTALLTLIATGPALVGSVVLTLVAVPCVRNSVDSLSDWVLALTSSSPSKEQTLQKRVDELEQTVRDLQGK